MPFTRGLRFSEAALREPEGHAREQRHDESVTPAKCRDKTVIEVEAGAGMALAGVVVTIRVRSPTKLHSRCAASRATAIVSGAALLLGVPLLVGCSGGADEGRVGTVQSSIAYGTLDTRHTAVVAVLSPVGTTALQECTGSIVALKGGEGYVLTAAHCCNTYVPTIVVASSDYAVGEQYLSGGTPTPPAYAVVAGSVYYDAAFDNAGGHDFCMLRVAGAGAGLATLALPASASDGLQLGSQVEHVGFGFTDTTTGNTQRRTGTDAVDQLLTPLLLEFSQGGANHVPGTCDGDSGGPSLLPAGVAQSQQVITAVQSFGNASSCAQETLGGASRVSSAIGTGQFITSYLAGSPVGISPGGAATAPSPVPAGGLWAYVVLAVAMMAAGVGYWTLQ